MPAASRDSCWMIHGSVGGPWGPRGNRALQSFAQLLVGGAEVFGLDAGFADDGHEISVTDPARQHVQVDVAGDTGSGSSSQIHAEIKTVGFVGSRKRSFGPLSQQHHFSQCF